MTPIKAAKLLKSKLTEKEYNDFVNMIDYEDGEFFDELCELSNDPERHSQYDEKI